MSHAKYLSSSLSGFGDEDFLSFHYMYIRKTDDRRGGAKFDPRDIIRKFFLEGH